MLKVFRLLIIVTVLSSCATTNIDQENKTVSYELTSSHCTNDNRSFEGYRKNESMTLLFPSIPGGVWGNPTNDILHYTPAIPSQKFSLKLPADMAGKATELTQQGLSIEPINTKILRLGTFHSYPDYQRAIGGGGFYQTKTGDFLILVYFSNPSVVTGTLPASGDLHEFNIKVKKKGWSWIKSSKVGTNKYTTTLYQGPIDSIEFCAYIPNLINT